MEQKKYIVAMVGALFAGVLAGFLIWGTSGSCMMKDGPRGTHRMPDGKMMHNKDMDMASMMADMNAALAGKTGDAFDKAFIEEMIVHHEGAVDMAELALTNAKRQEIKDLATAIIKAQTTEIAQMNTWLKTWYNK